MARTKSSQRGVIRVATTAILAAIGALLGATGCSSDEGSGGGERLGSVQQALVCNGVTCPANDCFVYTCTGKLNSCFPSMPKPDVSNCSDPNFGKGKCNAGVCCPGCLKPNPQGAGYTCEKGTEPDSCGYYEVCSDCTKDTCGTPVCDTQVFDCANKPFQDGDKCTDGSGTCYQGGCCQGCIDKQTDTCVPSNAAHCGISLGGLVGCESCNDSEPCTVDDCDANGKCQWSNEPDTKFCPDGDKCNGDEKCKTGVCTGPANFSCDDNNACTAESCDAQTGCAHQNLSGTPCLDANKCNGSESCSSGSCIPGTALTCEDNNACTNNDCSAASGCVNSKKADGTNCPDGNKCNGDEKCSNGSCTAGTAPNCNDGNPCTDDDCDPATGCTHTAVAAGTACDDSNKCNGHETCSGTVCTAGTAPNCNDGDPCTDDDCSPASGCVWSNNTADCNDGDPCTLTDKCAAGACKGSGAPNCDDNEDCTADTCAPGKGCQHNAEVDDTDCDDGNGCTTTDKCVGGKCKGSGGKVCEDNKACTQNACAADICSFPNENNGTPCVFDKCHQNSTCQAGACDQGEEIDYDDGNPCTIDSCDPATGPKHVADNAATCTDGDLCTTADKCKTGVCIGTDVVCTPPTECFEPGACVPATGTCAFALKRDGTECSIGECQGGTCKPIEGGGGGAGGEAPATGGDGPGPGTGGSAVAQGGEPATVNGGEGNEPVGMGGDGSVPVTGGKSSTGGTDTVVEGGEGAVVTRPFVRTPGGCSCSVPGSSHQPSGALALAGLAMAAALSRRRGRSARSAQRGS